MMGEVIVRKASFSDLENLLRFEQGVINAERPFDPTLKKGDIRYYDIEELITASHTELMVAEIDGELVGCGYARIENSEAFLQHSQHSYVGFIYVVPDQRGKAISNKILDALKTWSSEQGLTEMRLEVYDANLGAIRAYEKAGFQRHMLEMRVSL